VRAVVVERPGGQAGVQSVPDPSPVHGEVVVAVRGCGICGTDKHILEEGLPTVSYPLVPGHEAWGEVVAVGGEDRGPPEEGGGLQVGDVVAIDPSLHCGVCRRCRRGQGNLCEHWGAIGGTKAGAWADYVAVPVANAHVLRDFPLNCASIIEPVACALRGIHQLRPEPGQSALVVGGGTMGLLLAVLLEFAGVEPITVVETRLERRTVGQRLAQIETRGPDDLAGEDWDLVIDATGSPRAIESGIERVAPGGKFMVFGVASPDARVEFSPFRFYQREITIVGSMAILRTFSSAIEVVGRHPERFLPLLTHSFELQEFDLAVAALGDGAAVKVTLAPKWQ
jgi:2-desacetyl-2-hydroxyethyl bacteriochlorophyllide A dehydrogenase